MSKRIKNIFKHKHSPFESHPSGQSAPDRDEDDGHNSSDLHSNRQRIRDGAIILLDFASSISEATDLLKPLKAACGALKTKIDQVNEDWNSLIQKLNFQLATIENQRTKLEEDRSIDGTTPSPNPAITQPLQAYASELNQIYQLLCDNKPSKYSFLKKILDSENNKEIIAEKTRGIDESFQAYTTALHLFVASTVDQMQQELSQFHQGFLQEGRKSSQSLKRRVNAYGVQHVECLRGTRIKTLDAIRHWVDDENPTRWIFCLLDVAGSGKSTVAKHMAEEWKREQRLVARFFFSRDTTETMSTDRFCSTVGNAFALLDQNYKVHMDKFAARPDSGLLSFEEQFEGLVGGPLRTVNRPAILTIDALDECNNEHGGRDQLLKGINYWKSSLPLLRILITGRPERDIKYWAEEEARVGFSSFIQLEGDSKDVELYIKSRLHQLPSTLQNRLYTVIRHAEGLFIWGRIACDLLLTTADVETLLEALGKDVSLDYLYKMALEQSIPKDKASYRAIITVLQMVLAARTPFCIAELETLSPRRDVVEETITRLGSLLVHKDRDDPIQLLHTTFREFLTARSRAGIYFIQPEFGHYTLTSGCLRTIDHQLKQKHVDPFSQRKGT